MRMIRMLLQPHFGQGLLNYFFDLLGIDWLHFRALVVLGRVRQLCQAVCCV